jgi:RNA polymerase primary sigma factor
MAKTNTAETNDKADGGDAPVIDGNEASLKKLIARAKKRGVITVDELNGVVGDMSTDQIEDVMSSLNEMGINVVENEEADEDEQPVEADTDAGLDDNADGEGGTFIIEKRRRPSTARTIPSACTCARWARSNSSPAKGRLRSLSGSRPAATR